MAHIGSLCEPFVASRIGVDYMTSLNELKAFKALLGKYLEEYFEMVDSDQESEKDYKRFDIKITILDQEITLSSDADTYDNLCRLIDDRINEY